LQGRVRGFLAWNRFDGQFDPLGPFVGEQRRQIAALLLDLSALALRLEKPLTARLMPIPGKGAGDSTGFDFAFFANSKVMALDAEKLEKAFSVDEIIQLSSRK